MTWLEKHPWWWLVLLAIYYFGVIAALIAIYGRGDFSTPPFLYQGF